MSDKEKPFMIAEAHIYVRDNEIYFKNAFTGQPIRAIKDDLKGKSQSWLLNRCLDITREEGYTLAGYEVHE